MPHRNVLAPYDAEHQSTPGSPVPAQGPQCLLHCTCAGLRRFGKASARSSCLQATAPLCLRCADGGAVEGVIWAASTIPACLVFSAMSAMLPILPTFVHCTEPIRTQPGYNGSPLLPFPSPVQVSLQRFDRSPEGTLLWQCSMGRSKAKQPTPTNILSSSSPTANPQKIAIIVKSHPRSCRLDTRPT